MKKNNMLRLASVLLVAVLLSTCAISGVFAKYYETIDNESDNAVVGKWGVTLTSNDGSLFESVYAKDSTTTAIANTVVAMNYKDAANEGTNKFAPGTKDEWTPFVVAGQPEVAVEVAYTATVALTGDWVDENGDFYCPIVFTITNAGGEKATIKQSATLNTAALIAEEIEKALEKATAEYEANTDLGAEATFPTIAWEWAFEGDDAADSALGDAATAAISIEVGASVTQIN